tara:strand:- start:1764 stop:2246 length:483 start_codon:yes stop_codon:yes gene_type:complete
MSPVTLAKVYKLYNPNLTEFYIGSTKRTLDRRLGEHKSCIRNKKQKPCFLEDIDNLKIELIEEFEFTTNEDLLYRERYWFEKLKPSLNNNYPIRCKKEYHENYYKMHKQQILREKGRVLECEFCGCDYTKRHKTRHQRSLYCLEAQKEIQKEIQKNNNIK